MFIGRVCVRVYGSDIRVDGDARDTEMSVWECL